LTHVEEQRDEFKRQLEHANASGAATASRLEEQREAIRQQLEGAHAAAAAAIANLEQQREAIRQQLVDGNRAAEAALSHLEGQRDHYKAQLSELATVHEVVSREAESLKRLLDEAPHRIAARISRLARRVSAALAGGPQKGS
jgi:chromosome segregation ATPase